MTNTYGTPGQGSEYTSTLCTHFNYAPGDPRIAELGFGVVALDLAALGCHVLPLRRGGKPPHEMLGAQGGVHWAANDPGQILYWFGIEDMLANIGVRTGRLPFAGRQVVVADLDIKHGEDGPGNFARFLAENRLTLQPGYPVAHTPTGGTHIWMGWPVQWGACPRRLGILPGVDILGDDSYVVAPPSFLRVMPDGRDGNRVEPVPVPYQWVTGCPCSVPWAPPWFGQWVATAPATGRPPGEPGPPG